MYTVKVLIPLLFIVVFTESACTKDNAPVIDDYTYYEVGFASTNTDWRDTSIVVRTKNEQLIQQIENQLSQPVDQRKLVVGSVVAGSGGYNKNASHEFNWHYQEDDWYLTDATIEIYDGKPYTDVDVNLSYYLNNVKRFGAWSSYIKRKLPIGQ